MFSIKEIIWELFGNFYQANDSYTENDPANQNRGLLQRYYESLADELDANLIPKINLLIDKTRLPKDIVNTLVPIRELSLGLQTNLYEDLALRRKLLQYLKKCHRNRGTFQNYIFLFGLLGFDVEIDENYINGTWDDGTWDSGYWDSYLNINNTYTLTLTCRTPFVITSAIESQVQRIIEYNNPIYAQVSEVIYQNNLTTTDYNDADYDSQDYN